MLIGGSIRHKVENHAYVLTISSVSGLINVIGLINGYLRTPKIARFNQLIQWVNNKTGDSIVSCPVDSSDVLSNAWLSGFIDADGSFDIRVSLIQNGASKDRVSARLRLEQRMLDPNTGHSYFDVLSLIAVTLGITLKTSTHNDGVMYYLISASSAKSRLSIVNYLSQFPLFSSKYLNYVDWLTCQDMILDKSHTTVEGRSKAMVLKSGMNSKRTYYN